MQKKKYLLKITCLDIEAMVLSKAVKYIVDGKAFIDKHKTVVFK